MTHDIIGQQLDEALRLVEPDGTRRNKMNSLATIEHDTARTIVTPMDMLNKAVESGANMEVLTKLMDLQERYEKNQARKSFDRALSDAKAEFTPIVKNRTVDFEAKNGGARTNYRFEDLAQIEQQIGPILAKHGLSYRWRVESEVDLPVRVTCVLAHRDGHSEETTLVAGRDTSGNKNPIQSIGSTVTYLQRYTLKAAAGLAVSNDDDGKAVSSGGPLSDEQRDKMLALIESSGVDIAIFCEKWKVEAIAELPSSKFEEAYGSLKRWADGQKGGQA